MSNERPKLLETNWSALRAAEALNQRIALGQSIGFWSDFVKMTFPVRRAFVVDRSLFIDAGPFGEIAVAPQHYIFFSEIDLSDLEKSSNSAAT